MSNADELRFLQQRVSLYARMSATLVGIFTAFDIVGFYAGRDLLPPGYALTPQYQAWGTEVLVLLVLGVTAVLARRAKPTLWRLYALDGVATLCMSSGFASLINAVPASWPIPPAIGVFLVIQLLLTLHAGLVPAPWQRTFAVHCLALLPLGVLASLTPHVGPEWHKDAVVSGIAFFTLFFAAVSAVLSNVVYGLRIRVQKAKRLGQYQIEGRIGSGGMGVVYLAQHAMLKRPTAIKMLPPDSGSSASLQRFEREVRATSRLSHPNTIAIYDYGRTPEGEFYYAMEYLEGPTLRRAIDVTGPFDPGRVIHLLRQASGALAEAHGAGLVHRDIKPENIVIATRGGTPDIVKVLDFGLVKDLDAPTDVHLSQAGVLLGTPAFISPEAILGEDLGPAADIYSLCCVGYYLLEGEVPFRGRTVVEVCAKHLNEAPPKANIEGTPEALAALLHRGMAKDPGERPSAAELEEHLEALSRQHHWCRRDAEQWFETHGQALKPELLPEPVKARAIEVARQS